MSDQPSRPAQAGILVLGRVAQAIAEALVLLVIVRVLGKPEVGVLAAVLLIYQTASLILSAGFPASLMYFLPTRTLGERRAVSRRVAATLAMLGIGAGAVLAILGLIDMAYPGVFEGFTGTAAGGEVSLKYLLLLAAYPVVDMPVRMLPNLLIVEGRARAAAGFGIVRSLVNSLATILPVALGFDLWVVMGCLVVSGFALSTVLLHYLRALYRDAGRLASPVALKELFRFAVPLGLTEIVSIVNNRLDRYLIMSFFLADVFAEYQAGAWQIPFVTTIPFAVGAVYTPRFTELFKEGKPREAVAIWRQAVGKVSLLVLPLTAVFIVAAEETVELLFTSEYERATVVFRIYAIYTLGRVAAFGSVIMAAGKPGYIAKAALFSFLSNVAISVPLVLLIGFEGPALGTMLAFIPTVCVYCWYIARATSLRFGEIFPLFAYLKVAFVTALACGPAVALKLSVEWHAGIMLPLEAVLVLLSFALLGTLFGIIGRDDWRYAKDWVLLKVLRSKRSEVE